MGLELVGWAMMATQVALILLDLALFRSRMNTCIILLVCLDSGSGRSLVFGLSVRLGGALALNRCVVSFGSLSRKSVSSRYDAQYDAE